MTISTIIVFYIGTIITSYVMLKIYEKNSEKKLIINKKNSIIIAIISFLSIFNNMFSYIFLKFILSAILAYIMYKLIFKDNVKDTIYYTLIIQISLYILDVILSFFLPTWITNIATLNNNILFKFSYSIVVSITFYFIMTNKYIISFFRKIKNTSKSYKMFYIIGFIILIVCTIWGFYIQNDVANKTLTIILSITEITILICVIIVLQNKFEKNILVIKEEQLKQNLNLYSKISKEYKELKHNLMNDFLSIKTKLPKKEQSFINDIINKYQTNYDWVSDITDIPEGLQGLVFLKKHQAELQKITFNLEYNISKNLENVFEINKNFKLYETLGILFDNAIEGAYESKEKIINVLFSYNKGILKIYIYNTFNNVIDLDRIGKENYSTKKRGSGIGLNYLSKQKNKIKINQTIQNNIFITKVIFNIKEKK